MGKKLELAKSQYFFGIMDKSREREEGRDFFFGINNGEKWKEKEDSFGKKNKSGILVMEDKS